MTLTDPTQDLALLADMYSGSATAFDALYRKHQGPLFRFIALRCGSADTAADLVQEIFLGLMTKQLKFDPTRGALQGFLFGVARNLILKNESAHARFRMPQGTHDADNDADEILADQVSTALAPQEVLLANESAELVRHALAQLAPHYRDVVILYEMHELTYIEIAHICQIDIGTVRSRLSRARAKLAELLVNADFMRETPSHATRAAL